MLYVLIFLIGVIVGVIVSGAAHSTLIKGNLHIDQSEPDEAPLIFLELEKPVSELTRMKMIILKVVNKNYFSQD